MAYNALNTVCARSNSAALQHRAKNVSEFFIFPSKDKRVAYGIEKHGHVVDDILQYHLMVAAYKWFATEGSEGSNNQHRDDTE